MGRVRAELRRRDVVEATVRVIAEHGAAGATTRRIAAEAGCPLATLHYVFHTKEDLFYAVYEAMVAEAQALGGDDAHSQPLRDMGPDHLRRLVCWLTEQPAIARAQAEMFHWALRFNPELARRSYVLSLDRARDFFATASDATPANQPLRDALARLIVVQIDGLLAAWFAQADLARLQADTELACGLMAQLADGGALLAPAPAKAPT